MKRITLLLALFLCLVTAGPAYSVVVEDLYAVELPVADQTTTQRLEIFKQAFKEVIIKISGTTTALEQPGFNRPLNNSARYVRQFRYFTRQAEIENSFDSGQLILRVQFDQDAIENLMREYNIPIWGKERPSTLMLISFDVNKNASIVSGDTTPEVIEELDKMAKRQGLPVLFPLLDLEDRLQFGIRDIIDNNEANLEVAAARYDADAVVAGQLVGRAGEGWQGIWQVRFADQLFSWSYRAGSRQEVMQQGISYLAQTLALEYALETQTIASQPVLFRVVGSTALADHVRVLTYLQSLDVVASARLVLIHEDRVTYRINLRNSADDLSRLIALGNLLEQQDLPQINAASDDRTVIMDYRLIK